MTPAHRYLEKRGLSVDRLDLGHCLRWNMRIGAIVAKMVDPVTGNPSGVHRTFINPDGLKRERKMLGRKGVICLSPFEDVTQGLGLVEGVEDGLAVLLSGWSPIWCACDAGNLAKFPVLAGIDCLTIFADADSPGMSAAEPCAERWNAAGREARIAPPPRAPA